MSVMVTGLFCANRLDDPNQAFLFSYLRARAATALNKL
jgi:hypothetical protein